MDTESDLNRFLNLMFRPDETVSVSTNKYGYHSVPLQNVLDNKIVLAPVKNRPGLTYEQSLEYPDRDQLIFVALNPINGFRTDSNVYRYRNLMVELDTGTVDEQLAYLKQLRVPFSAQVFSGSKSVHTLISLDQDLPSEKIYRWFAEWTLNIITLADQNIKNPSRSIRIPGAIRPETGNPQRLIEFNGPVSTEAFASWLSQYPHLKPSEKVRKPRSENPDFDRLSPWVVDKLKYGIDRSKGRNKEWFTIGCDMVLCGYSESDAVDILSQFFSEDPDFKTREFLTAIKSAYKHMAAKG